MCRSARLPRAHTPLHPPLRTVIPTPHHPPCLVPRPCHPPHPILHPLLLPLHPRTLRLVLILTIHHPAQDETHQMAMNIHQPLLKKFVLFSSLSNWSRRLLSHLNLALRSSKKSSTLWNTNQLLWTTLILCFLSGLLLVFWAVPRATTNECANIPVPGIPTSRCSRITGPSEGHRISLASLPGSTTCVSNLALDLPVPSRISSTVLTVVHPNTIRMSLAVRRFHGRYLRHSRLVRSSRLVGGTPKRPRKCSIVGKKRKIFGRSARSQPLGPPIPTTTFYPVKLISAAAETCVLRGCHAPPTFAGFALPSLGEVTHSQARPSTSRHS